MEGLQDNKILEIYFETYGCTANYNSSEIMAGLVKQAGLNITNNPELADVVIINSCIVKEPTEAKIIRRIQYIHKENPKIPIILAGCMSSLYEKRLRKLGCIKQENLFLLGTRQIKNITNMIKSIQEGFNGNDKELRNYLEERNEEKASLPKIPSEKTIGICQISEGCLGECSYCITKKAKGKLYSFPEEEIIKSIKNDLESGAKEIWLTSQDNANYGNDSGKCLLPELLEKILEIPGRHKIRLGMMNPDSVLKILDELIEIYKKFSGNGKKEKLFRFLHIPIQSGSNKVLRDMKRKYKKEDVRYIINRFKKEIPDITISTDIIVGFPTETEEDFQETLDFVKEIKPEIINRSNFYPRIGTVAEEIYHSQEKGDRLDPEAISDRSKRLEKLHLQICNELQKLWIGREIEVLVDKKGWPGTFLGRTPEYKLVALQLKPDEGKKDIRGKFVKAKVEKTSAHYLICSINN